MSGIITFLLLRYGGQRVLIGTLDPEREAALMQRLTELWTALHEELDKDWHKPVLFLIPSSPQKVLTPKKVLRYSRQPYHIPVASVAVWLSKNFMLYIVKLYVELPICK